MALSTSKRRGILLLLAIAAAVTALTLIALMPDGRGSPSAIAAVKHATKHAAKASDPDTAQVGDQTSPDPAGPVGGTAAVNDPAGNGQAGGPDPAARNDPAGNSQAGGPDPAAGNDPVGNSHAGGPDPAGTSESSTDSEQGQPGESANGHADPAGSAGSDCTGNCVQ